MQATRLALALKGPKRPGGNSAPRHHLLHSFSDAQAGHKYAVNSMFVRNPDQWLRRTEAIFLADLEAVRNAMMKIDLSWPRAARG